tara:strand:+ start:162 stop:479 length:318 start_codon:yes stop_codon:yes gene_type:complete
MKFIELLTIPIYLGYGALIHLVFNALNNAEISMGLMLLTCIVTLLVCIFIHVISATNLEVDFTDYELSALAWHQLRLSVTFVLFFTLPIIITAGIFRWGFGVVFT